jgi:choline kinase
MKAIILAAGFGSRLRPLTDENPKSLLRVGEMTIMDRMLKNIEACGINDVVIVTGYMREKIVQFIADHYSHLTVNFIHNEDYETTNTAYSLLLTREATSGDDFVKFDADVVFEQEILKKLLAAGADNYLCVDKNINLAAEEVKVKVGDDGKIVKASKNVAPADAVGESIGIEKISRSTSAKLFDALEKLLVNPENRQEYYEAAYEMLIEAGSPFYPVDITGSRWVEIDTHEDYQQANQLFN